MDSRFYNTEYVIASQVLNEFVRRIDSGAASSVIELCTDDVTMAALGLTGDAELLAMQMKHRDEAGYESRHTVNTVRINDADEAAISGDAYIVSFRRKDGVFASVAAADWAFRLERTDKGWFFSHIGLDPFTVLEHAQ